MKHAANLRDFRLGLLLPASRINTSAADYRVVTYMQLTARAGTR
jgi:branched-chain amino acid transport system substrate-binding protein